MMSMTTSGASDSDCQVDYLWSFECKIVNASFCVYVFSILLLLLLLLPLLLLQLLLFFRLF